MFNGKDVSFPTKANVYLHSSLVIWLKEGWVENLRTLSQAGSFLCGPLLRGWWPLPLGLLLTAERKKIPHQVCCHGAVFSLGQCCHGLPAPLHFHLQNFSSTPLTKATPPKQVLYEEFGRPEKTKTFRMARWKDSPGWNSQFWWHHKPLEQRVMTAALEPVEWLPWSHSEHSCSSSDAYLDGELPHTMCPRAVTSLSLDVFRRLWEETCLGKKATCHGCKALWFYDGLFTVVILTIVTDIESGPHRYPVPPSPPYVATSNVCTFWHQLRGYCFSGFLVWNPCGTSCFFKKSKAVFCCKDQMNTL